MCPFKLSLPTIMYSPFICSPGATDTGLAKGVANESLPGEGDQVSKGASIFKTHGSIYT